ncbi:hypothetical protein BN7_279 [Wickerhamomyces ciferrii]|uniref:Uncharacterized protein n=1 Tax=Wickerhamomyces ciferrii (strain ATCC 14091 / BCRC 22168 / CBS 111 / JCM 3599 / NBRC 0793 / NRRL Y-1031 F-60-10) TaxID=1206466 RepID=K0K7F0_WICCF|nr:uncharacterized protein BN7_279 [Wickerhamomyces ciferrii]CCH40745.1 hypothetical protein BN7_279 [Wickerhamomyces ciferrii]
MMIKSEQVLYSDLLLAYVRPALRLHAYFKLLLVYPIQYYITVIHDHICLFLSQVFTKLRSTHSTILNFLCSRNPDLTFHNMGPLPAIIWMNVMVIGGADGKELTRLNSAFYKELGPTYYKKYQNIQALMVISTTKKMRRNDFNYLTFGPDFPQVPYEDFSIYQRNFISSKYQYEVLDVYSTKTYKDSECDSVIVTSYSQVEFLFKEILKNPDSLLRRCIENISVDVSILDGTEEVFENSLIKYTTENINSENPSVTKLEMNTPLMSIGKDHEEFNWCRWNNGNSVLWSTARFSKEPCEPSNEIFPTNVYFGEFLPIAEQFDYYHSNKRSELSEFVNLDSFRNENPMSNYSRTLQRVDRNTFPSIVNQFSANKCHDIKIKRRAFKTEKDVLSTLDYIMGMMASEKYECENISTSLLMNGFIPERNLENHFGGFTQTIRDFKTSMVLINKRSAQVTSRRDTTVYAY